MFVFTVGDRSNAELQSITSQ